LKHSENIYGEVCKFDLSGTNIARQLLIIFVVLKTEKREGETEEALPYLVLIVAA
jgi:hypothetical protein